MLFWHFLRDRIRNMQTSCSLIAGNLPVCSIFDTMSIICGSKSNLAGNFPLVRLETRASLGIYPMFVTLARAKRIALVIRIHFLANF